MEETGWWKDTGTSGGGRQGSRRALICFHSLKRGGRPHGSLSIKAASVAVIIDGVVQKFVQYLLFSVKQPHAYSASLTSFMC